MPSLSILQTSFPLLRGALTGHVLQWNNGEMYKMLLAGSSVRINKLGIQWCVLCGGGALEETSNVLVTQFPLRGWSEATLCGPAFDALCSGTDAHNRTLTLFPVNVVQVPLEDHIFHDSVKPCYSHTANRQITSAARGYDVSVCDLVDSNLEFLLDVNAGKLYWKEECKPVWWSVLLTLSCLFFFTRVCQHLAMLVQGARRPFSVFTTLAMVGMLVLWRCLLWGNVLCQDLVTQEALALNFVLETYCYIYICAEVISCLSPYAGALCSTQMYFMLPREANEKQILHDISTLGSLLAAQLILTAQLANTYENPFLGILTLLFGSRCFLKFMNFILQHTEGPRSAEKDKIVVTKFVFLSIDTVTLCCIFELGVRAAAESETQYASTVSGMLVIIVLGGLFLHKVIVLNQVANTMPDQTPCRT